MYVGQRGLGKDLVGTVSVPKADWHGHAEAHLVGTFFEIQA